MKIALLGDVHFGCRNNSPVFQELHERSLKWLFDELNDKNIKTLIQVGDLFDVRKQVNFTTAKLAREHFLEPLHRYEIETHIIQGNHDSYWKNTHEVNALDELIGNRYPNIKTWSVPEVVKIGDISFQFLPWITASNQEASLACIRKPRAEIAIGHLEVKDFLMFRGAIATEGLELEELSRFDRVFSGHYHHRSTKGNVTFIGAFNEIVWSDYDDPRGYNIFDTETRELDFIKNPFQMFRMVYYDDRDEDMIEKMKYINMSELANRYVKVKCINKTNPYVFDLFIDNILKMKPVDLQVVDNNVIEEAEIEVEEIEETSMIIGNYIDAMETNVDKALLKKLMTNIYHEAEAL